MAKALPKIIIGLGNYGDKYAYTFHNMGFMVVDCLGDRLKSSFKLKDKLHCRMSEYIDHEGNKIVLAQPWTYMNSSGICVDALMSWYDVPLENIVVVYDDLEIAMGAIRCRQKGSAGTHNGMRNIIKIVGSEDFARIRIGIGKPPAEIPLFDWVTGDIPKDQRPIIAKGIEEGTDAVEKWLKGELFK